MPPRMPPRATSLRHRFAGILPIALSVLIAVVLFSLSRTIRKYLTASALSAQSSPASNATTTTAAAGAEPEPMPEPQAGEGSAPQSGLFDANDASSILVTNMSLIFSILYGFIFNRSYQRFDDISRVFSSEIANLHQLVNLIRLIDFDVSTQRNLLVRLRHYAFQIRHECLTGEVLSSSHSVDDLYALIPYIKKLVTTERRGAPSNNVTADVAADVAADATADATATAGESSVAFDREMLNSSLESIKSLLEARYERWDLFSKNIHGCLKLLLIISANLTFFGVSLMQSGSPRIDFLYCTLTIVSIAVIMAALSDLDQFFTGFMKLDTAKLEILFHFSGESGDEGDGTTRGKDIGSSSLLRTAAAAAAAAAVQPDASNSRRFAEQMMSEVSTNKLRHRSLKEVSGAVLKDIQASRRHGDTGHQKKYAVVEIEKKK